ncbi:beta-ketoacyl synthase, C-terminal domain protein [Mycobacterium kansasii]|uniref:Beta-ketoacyl synthase, C-terminal domain protein n=1 Tax=Mycobacterium kansasii TaxID=1768 RepID=A0A1V3WHM9_MYCKA|nr:beta-ketoacyl synthase, C-terminal domain protein [Mycobacterium kansasii]
MACRLPSGIDSPEALWTALLRGDDLVSEVPGDRWDADEYYDPEPGVPGRSVSRWGGFLDDVAGFDAEFFGIGEREATAMDPQQRLLLETSWEAVEHAGLAPKSLTGTLTGVFIGIAHSDYAHVTAEAGALEDAYGFTGIPFSMASGRISYALGLRGPAVSLDTACSSSLFAVHMACRSLNDGESDLALAGGCMVMLEPRIGASASALGMLSPTGRCRAFDVSADGFVRSEGCAVVLLKRLRDALRDGDRILAVLRGTATNQDGRTENISIPSAQAQAQAYRAALRAAGVDPATIGMVEAHGTGTPVGDPVEFTSLAEVYGVERACAIGSAKSNLGHTEAASGVVGLIKAILSLQHGRCRRCCTSPNCPMAWPGLIPNFLCRRTLRPGPNKMTRCPAGGGVVVWDVGHQRARHCGTGSGRCDVPRPGGLGGAVDLCAVRHVGRGVARQFAPAGRVAGRTPAPRRHGIVESGLHVGTPARPPAGPYRSGRRQPGRADRAPAPGGRGRTPLSRRRRPRRPRPGVGVLGSGFAMDGDGRRAVGQRTGVRLDRRRARAGDRRGIRLFGHRRDVRPAHRHRHRPGPTDAVRRSGRACGHDVVLRSPSGRGDRPFAG